ncbi:MAG: hypothetical protein J4G19_00070, partial [Pseudomonadales bacterium]|nr:hypothetical protein [Pseudomonadales bacterium]
MPDYERQFSNDSIACKQDENVLSFQLLGNRVNYESLDSLATAIIAAHDDPNVRAVAIQIIADGDDPENMMAVPQRFQHRVPEGSHGPGPIVEQATLTALRNFTKPLIAYMRDVVNGIAIDLAAACDIRVANSSMSMC